ncbi:acyl-CoA-binding domain-containing protein 5A-like isoform X2 [Homarus americanus]|uniref:acyl-CoA-binding domain-containing protein 5A-like isoform X2 n=1 Tax=Homarus americanus TaxID=6706 RepID=UPI001C444D5D|nr:acyl-CoA-binding domain-containing protein 5A-like isoform X2 [Homarus americanus]
MTTEDKFQAAVNIIRNLPKEGPYQPSHDMMLKFYGLYKQAVLGPCTEPKPAFYELVKGYKWRAWYSLGNMTKEEAKFCYVDELKKIIETMSYTEDVANFIDVLGPFYEFIDVPFPGMTPRNNNTKGLPEDDEPNSHNGDMEGTNNFVSNGDLHVHKINGNQESDSESGSDIVQLSSEESSPQISSSASIGPVEVTLAQELKDVDEEEDSGRDDDELTGFEVQDEESITHTVSVAPRVYSDSDSDEEYSEPAEINTAPLPITPATPPTTDTSAAPPPVLHHEEPQTDAVMCGGGDQSHPGGLQMTPRQIQYSSRGTQRGLQVSSVLTGGFAQIGGGSGGAGGGGGNWDGTNLTEDVNAQLMVVLRRLQTDMESVLHRLNTLETLTVTQHHNVCHHCQGGSSSVSGGSGRPEPSWWPFPELSPRSTFFLLAWPLMLHGGIKLLLLLRSRRRRT